MTNFLIFISMAVLGLAVVFSVVTLLPYMLGSILEAMDKSRQIKERISK